ncbi:MAG: hypothetical protein H6R07_1888 [Proteobacteria bacterium]|nr:hypothetical protein [Pseudomonadota bacterium]
MALYKYGSSLQPSQHSAFDSIHSSGEEAIHPGIYRCVVCGDEVVIAKGHTLPSPDHHQHKPGLGPIKWMLAVFAQSN